VGFFLEGRVAVDDELGRRSELHCQLFIPPNRKTKNWSLPVGMLDIGLLIAN
jgi:hypothetical protein